MYEVDYYALLFSQNAVGLKYLRENIYTRYLFTDIYWRLNLIRHILCEISYSVK